MDVFFVCGAPKSGTTWLQRILDAHPQVSCSGEGHFIDRFAGPIAEVIRGYNQALETERHEVYEGRPYYEPVSQAEFDSLVRSFVEGRLRSRPHPPGTRWFGDKTPLYTDRLGDLSRIFPQAKLFHIVRDPRDVIVSRIGHRHRAGAPAAQTPGTPEHRLELEAGIGQWLRSVQAVDAFAAQHPDQVLEVRYDQLHSDAERQLARAFAFLGAATTPDLLAQIAQATSFEAMTGRKPGEEDLGAFLRKGISGDWQQNLDRVALDAVMAACGPLMRAKGFLDA